MTEIPMVDLDRERAEIGDKIDTAVDQVLDSGYFVLGDEVSSFEEEFAKAMDAGYAVGVNSGTDAIMLALRALDIGPEDEVILPSHTATATAAAVKMVGATPVYADVTADTMVLDVDDAETRLTNRTAAIISVHLYGHPVDMDALMEMADRHDINVVEDCAQAHGATYNGEQVGTFGDIGAFSFYPTKNLGAYGDGGATITESKELAEDMKRLREYGWETRYRPEEAGVNTRLDEIQAAILRAKLPFLHEWNERRRRNAALYDELLSDTAVETPMERDNARHVYHLYAVRHDNRDALQEYLSKAGVQTQVHYPLPVHRQTGYETNQHLPVSQKITETVLSLPVHPFLEEDEVRRVAEKIKEFT